MDRPPQNALLPLDPGRLAEDARNGVVLTRKSADNEVDARPPGLARLDGIEDLRDVIVAVALRAKPGHIAVRRVLLTGSRLPLVAPGDAPTPGRVVRGPLKAQTKAPNTGKELGDAPRGTPFHLGLRHVRAASVSAPDVILSVGRRVDRIKPTMAIRTGAKRRRGRRPAAPTLTATDPRNPAPSSLAVRNVMLANRGRGTTPERVLARALRLGGAVGYRLHRRVEGIRPDLVFGRGKVAVFVHGCFWHGCRVCRLPLPATNRAFWAAKFARNRAR